MQIMAALSPFLREAPTKLPARWAKEYKMTIESSAQEAPADYAALFGNGLSELRRV